MNFSTNILTKNENFRKRCEFIKRSESEMNFEKRLPYF